MKPLTQRKIQTATPPAHIKVRCREGRPLIYESSWRIKTKDRAIYYTLNAIGWVIWTYLWKGLLTAVFWTLAGWWAQHKWEEAQGLQGLQNFVQDSMPLGLGLVLALWGWGVLRYYLFPRPLRLRLPRQEPNDAAGLRSGETLGAKVLRCHHNGQGALVEAEPLVVTQPSPQAHARTAPSPLSQRTAHAARALPHAGEQDPGQAIPFR
jgi:hypothetical protein